jgi:hypothetical protein
MRTQRFKKYDETINSMDLPIKDFIQSNSSFIKDALPEELSYYYDRDPKYLLSEVVNSIKRADFLFKTSMDELVSKAIEEQKDFLNRAEKSVTSEDKLYREKAQLKIAELNNWNPQSAAAKQVKKRLIEKVNNDVDDYFADVYGITRSETEIEIKRRLEKEIAHIIFIIEQKKLAYHKALECQKEAETIKLDLSEDLKFIQ